MALLRGACGEWLDVPEEGLRSEVNFKRWYVDHHWPYCADNPKRFPMIVVNARRKMNAIIRVVEFSAEKHYQGVEVIPERPADGVWRVSNKRSQSWPMVKVGDLLDITDLDDIRVIDRDRFIAEYDLTDPPPVAVQAQADPS